MDEQKRASLLGDLATDAGRQRERFLDEAGHAFARFIRDNERRLKELGGLVLIDDEPDYLFVSEDGTFRSRTRYQDEDGEWVSETEDIEDAEELVEIFNPADLYAAFVDVAELEVAGEQADDEDQEEPGAPGSATEAVGETVVPEAEEEEPVVDDDWAAPVPAPASAKEAARVLYDLALTFQERSQWREAQLLDDFGVASVNVAAMLEDTQVVEDEDERIWFRSSGAFEGEVVPEEDDEGNPVWQALTSPDELVQFYDPTDLFGDLAEAIAEQHPHVAPEIANSEPSDAEDD